MVSYHHIRHPHDHLVMVGMEKLSISVPKRSKMTAAKHTAEASFLFAYLMTIGTAARSRRGRLKENVDPWPTALSTQIWPPWARTIAWQM
jgi:hypothetical protein